MSALPMKPDVDPAQAQADLEAMLLGQVATNEQAVANTRANMVATTVGLTKEVPKGGRVLGTFGPTAYADDVDSRVVAFGNTQKKTAPAPVQAAVTEEAKINLNAVANSMVTGTPTFNIEHEFAKVKSIANFADREEAAQQLYVNIATQATSIGKQLTDQARQRAGVNDAEKALNSFIAIENQMKANGQLPAYASSMQVRQARETYQKTLVMANAEETDLVKNNPQLNTFKRYDSLLQREFGQIDRSQQKQDAVDAALPLITDENLANVSYALGLNSDDPVKIKSAFLRMKNDKALTKVVEFDKNTAPRLLVDADPRVRQYAYRILVENEKKENNGQVPDYVKLLEPLVANREALLDNDARKQLNSPTSDYKRAVGNQAMEETKGSFLLNNLNNAIQATSQRKYQNMNNWTITDPQIRGVMEGLRQTSKNPANGILMSDGVQAVMTADIKMPDGSAMRPEERIRRMTESLSVSMDNDRGSVLIPSAEHYKGPLSAQMRNMAMRAYISSKKEISLVPGFPGSGGFGLGVTQ